ncbi:DUF4286 family protein [Endozoicomonas sp. SCSIO W0465]|uniref:DUF4286 family protein n=1 Tax=Endozoicomonas sp. SCSIO W0465 TaxID=2918516 RepID=UPI002075B766|nr:DUF4286 family protein [Endozoicomonas sp. SCSIO W0465]USE38901.1 DUF4286 family protein [Endozoicomonas sp. SCSIO W0465]
MIIYEVNCLVDNGIVDEFRAWLTPHVEAVLQAEGFHSAQVFKLTDDEQLTARPYSTGFSIRYRVSGQSALDHYLLHLAPALRRDGIDTFGNQFTTYRRVLTEDA